MTAECKACGAAATVKKDRSFYRAPLGRVEYSFLYTDCDTCGCKLVHKELYSGKDLISEWIRRNR
jgi:hypothetical protein